MAWPDSDYPGALDSPPDPDATLDGTPLHSDLHLWAGDAIEKMQQAFGTNPQGGFSDVAAAVVEFDRRGRVAAVTGATQVTGITTVQDITGFSLTFTPVAGRRYRVHANVPIQQISSTGTPVVSIADGANAVLSQRRVTLEASYNDTVPVDYEFVAATSTSHTVKLRAQTDAGTLTIRPSGLTGQYTLAVDDVTS